GRSHLLHLQSGQIQEPLSEMGDHPDAERHPARDGGASPGDPQLPGDLSWVAFSTPGFSACNLASEGVQALLPKSAKLVDPIVNLLERLGMNGIESPGAVDADLDEPALAKCAQMLRNTRLSDAELFLDDLGETTRGAFTPNQELENPTAHRIAEDVE